MISKKSKRFSKGIFKGVIFFLFFSNFLYSQKQKEDKFFRINVNKEYVFLDTILKDKKMVLLGEQSHGDGVVFDEKVELIKYLHEHLGYNTIAFESGLYDNYKAYKEYLKDVSKISMYDESVFGIWSDTKSFHNLISYVKERAVKHDTIKILGFDLQEGSLFENYFMGDFKNMIDKHKIKVSENDLIKIEKAFVFRDLYDAVNNQKDSIDLYESFEKNLKLIEEIKNQSLDDKVLIQVFRSKIAAVSFEIQELQNQRIIVQNPRDEQMAKNLIFLGESFPKDKIICWGASYHFSKNIDQVIADDVTENYFEKLSEIEKKNTGYTDYKKNESLNLLKGALPMGGFLKGYFKDKIYSIAFSNYEGEYGLVNTKPYSILSFPVNSIENILVNKQIQKCFVELNSQDEISYYSSVFGNVPFKALWGKVFDALIFIKKTYQPEIKIYPKNNDVKVGNSYPYIKGKVYDLKYNRSIANAQVSFLSSKQNLVTNKNGEFVITISKNNIEDKLIVSGMGYLNDTIAVSKLIEKKVNYLKIGLKPYKFEGIQLDNVVISSVSKILTAEQILEKAKINIENNYYQNPYNQDFFYRTQILKKGKLTSHMEAVVKTYNENGMKGLNSPDAEIKGELFQFRNLINNGFEDINHFAFIFDRDVILSKSNVLYKTASYKLKKEGMVVENDRRVYKISFVNNDPGTYSTGYGYPAPEKSSGVVYIDASSFAVLRYEHCVVRRTYELKKEQDKNAQMKHKIVVTYKNFEGKYFMNYCYVIDKIIVTSKKDNSIISENYKVNNVMSTKIDTSNVEKIDRTLFKLDQNVNLVSDSSYWEDQNFMVQDDKIVFDFCD
ncbi:Erythromycin esterase homolog [Flavobacterium terrae]|uniref:Erythromycin esterase homolog n=2 Tax=Flavobacterium terrae TaxID=415425 RepID=A0A1M6BMA8_9FLAO|nr:Erythromycin esterase homolog [Flavobacterium terrae]